MEIKNIFETSVKNNLWGDVDSLSGPGSNLAQTVVLRREIPKLIKEYEIQIFLDAPCGDFFWMKEIINEITSSNCNYIGIDIVKNLIDNNNKDYLNAHIKFVNLDIISNMIPCVDLVLTRDCFIHLSYDLIYKILKNFKKSKSKYILLSTYTNENRININVKDVFINGRALNMEKFPFCFPKPIKIINENCTESNGDYSDKSLALWNLNEIILWRIFINIKYDAIRLFLSKVMKYLKKI
jgi:hypothetical protein